LLRLKENLAADEVTQVGIGTVTESDGDGKCIFSMLDASQCYFGDLENTTNLGHSATVRQCDTATLRRLRNREAIRAMICSEQCTTSSPIVAVKSWQCFTSGNTHTAILIRYCNTDQNFLHAMQKLFF